MPFYFLVACTMGVFCDGLDHFLWFIPLFSLFFFRTRSVNYKNGK